MNESDFKVRFGNKLNRLRKQRGLTQYDLAKDINYSDKAVSKWERGESVPDAFTLYKIAEYFDVKIDDLFSEESPSGSKVLQGDSKARSIRLFVPLFSILGVFFLASVAFFVMKNVPAWNSFASFSFIYALPAAAVVMLVFSSIWWNYITTCTSVSLLIWSVAFAIYSSLNIENIKYIFVICIVLQIVCILGVFFAYFFTKGSRKN